MPHLKIIDNYILQQ